MRGLYFLEDVFEATIYSYIALDSDYWVLVRERHSIKLQVKQYDIYQINIIGNTSCKTKLEIAFCRYTVQHLRYYIHSLIRRCKMLHRIIRKYPSVSLALALSLSLANPCNQVV